ncbi:MAG: hypothetical protein WEB58_09240 [Planctomycetaceae bacterium]
MPYIHGKSLGQKRPLFADFSVPLRETAEGSTTVRELIAEIVRDQVKQFDDRQKQRQFLRVLTERDIAEGVERGKIESGQTDVPLQPVDVEAAVETALLAFQDGLYLVVIDEENVTSLDDRRTIRPDSHITFVRLTLLAGG